VVLDRSAIPIRESHGQRRRRAILESAADVSTGEGLEGLSIGRLAGEVGLSKSGVATYFESKQDLQLAAVETAAWGYDQNVLAPPRAAEPGLARLELLMSAWIDHVDGISYRGGCFFAAAGNEFAGRPGPVRDRVAAHTASFGEALEREARLAKRLGELRDRVDPRLLVFQLHALVQEANLRRGLLDDEGAFDDARAVTAQLLRDASHDPKQEGDSR
jgi:AcrR family transcriptional regulator